MIRKKLSGLSGFTVIELAITVIVMVIPILVVGIILADSHRSWHAMYNRVNSDVVTDSYIAAKVFDRLVRRASKDGVFIDDDNKWVEVYYCQDNNSVVVDRYAFFYVADGDLMIQYGRLGPKEALSTRTVCQNVSGCIFKQVGQSIRMILKLDDGMQTNDVISSAVMHN